MARDRTVVLEAHELRIKIATKRTVKAVHGTAIAAELAETKQQRISDCQVPNTREFLRIDEVIRIEEAARGTPEWPAITRAQARHHGFALLPMIDEDTEILDGEWGPAVASAIREANEACARVCSAMPEGVTPEEIVESEIVEEIDQAVAAFLRLRALAVATRERKVG